MTNNKKYNIFISYSRANSNIKDKIVRDLRDYGFDVWVDNDSISLAKNWTDEIKKGIQNSKIVLYLASPESIDSTYISYELGYADALNKIILPIRIKGRTWEECVPSWYSVTQGMELRGSQYEKRKIKLFESIRDLLSDVNKHDKGISFNDDVLIDEVEVIIGIGRYLIKKYKSTTIKVLELATGNYVTAHPLLRQINNELKLGISLDTPSGDYQKNTRQLGSEVIKALQKRQNL